MKGHVVITGGAGFIGTNLADRLLRDGRPVLVFDDLSRAGVEKNLEWLRAGHGSQLRISIADVRDARALARAVRGAAAVFHFAAQVAVTSSLVDPLADFAVNAQGTLNLLEALRAQPEPPPVFFTSTNKVYGRLADVALCESVTRREPVRREIATHGLSEGRPLDFHSPYGCSKGAADQYVLDYARTFGIPAVVFRMSCIYGPHQYGTEDQGWLAHFLIRAIEGRTITLYGDGKQVRDVLYVDDLVRAFLAAWSSIDRLAGNAFNVGGGPENTISLLELLREIERIEDRRPAVTLADWREADQRWYVSDTRRLRRATGWKPEVDVRSGVERLHRWLRTHRVSIRSTSQVASPVAVPLGSAAGEEEVASP